MVERETIWLQVQSLRLIHCADRTEISDKPWMMAPTRKATDAEENHGPLDPDGLIEATNKTLDAAALWREPILLNMNP